MSLDKCVERLDSKSVSKFSALQPLKSKHSFRVFLFCNFLNWDKKKK